MVFRRFVVIALLAALPLAAAAAASARPDAIPTLKGTDGPGFTISLKRSGGNAVKSLNAGRYKFVISDKASVHGFTLEQAKGGKFEKVLSPVPFVGTKTVGVTLKTGRWKFYCQAHESTMFGFFTVK